VQDWQKSLWFHIWELLAYHQYNPNASFAPIKQLYSPFDRKEKRYWEEEKS
jgi:hypothetical protein